MLFLIYRGVIGPEWRTGVESLFTLLLLCFFIALRRALHAKTGFAYLIAGLLLGAASCVRSTALLFPVFLVLLAFPFKGGWPSLVRSACNAALVLAGALLVLSPWIIRNYNLVGQFIPTASVQGISMQVGDYICAHEGGKTSLGDLDIAASDVRNEMAAEQGYRFRPAYYQMFFDPRDEVRFNNSLARQTLQHYLHSPGLFAKCASENILNFWFAGKTRHSTIANICLQLPFMLLALA